MATALRAPRDFWSGLIFATTGVAAVVLGRESSIGTATRMGPGYFPTVLGVLLAFIGLALVVRAFFSQGQAISAFAARPLLLVLGATILFGLVLRGAGLIVALIVLVMVSAPASRLVRWAPAIVLAVGLAAFSTLVFVRVLGLPIPLVGRWFGA